MSKKHEFDEEMKPDMENEGQEHMDEAEQAEEVSGETAEAQEEAPVDPAKEAEEARLRALAEMENFKKRLQRDFDIQVSYATEKVLSDLLPSLDNLDLALQYGSKVEACKNMVMGVEMTRKLLLDTLKRHGLESVGQEGDEFNPEFHEAMGQEATDAMEPNHVVHVLQRGYKLKDRLLRPAKVMVSKAN